MAVQQPEWASQPLSGQRRQQKVDIDDSDNQDLLHSRQLDFARPETPLTAQLPNFPLPKSYTGPRDSRAPLRDNARNLNQNPSSPVMHRRRSSSSFSSVSAITNQLSSSLVNIHPAPAYVGSFGATQVVSEHQAGLRDSPKDDEDAETTSSANNNVVFSLQALALVNGFLDQLLFSFLAYAKSTSLAELRPAVIDVLMPRLAGEAIASAEEELQELLGDGGEEDVEQRQSGEESRWDLELVWKRTRLRVMVYIRLGDMEDDDEERYVREGEHVHSGTQRFSQSTGLVSWAAAIFLTSIVEYVAEQVLRVAGQAAIDRAKAKSRYVTSPVGPITGTEALIVEDYDMERVALDSSLSRVWRKWRKAQRNASSGSSPRTPINRHTRNQASIGQTVGSLMSPRRSSFDTAFESPESRRESLETARETPYDKADEALEFKHPEAVMAANIPLPLEDHGRDVDEIEVPGLAMDPDESATTEEAPDLRRNSFSGQTLSWLPIARFGSITSANSADASGRPLLSRQRSSSVPANPRVSYLHRHAQNTAAVEDPEQAVEKKGDEAIATGLRQTTGATDTTTLDKQPTIKGEKEEELREPSVSQQVEETATPRSGGLPADVVAGVAAATAMVTAKTLSGQHTAIATNALERQEQQSSVTPQNALSTDDEPRQLRDAPHAVHFTSDAPKDEVIDGTESTLVRESTALQPNADALTQMGHVLSTNNPSSANGVLHLTETQVQKEAPNDDLDRSKADLTAHDVGVAQSSDICPTSSGAETTQAPGSSNADETHVATYNKTQPRRPAKLVLGASATDFAPSPTSQVSSLGQQDGHAYSAEGGLAEPRSISMSPHSPHFEKRRTPSPNEQTRFPASILVNRNGGPNASQRPLTTEQQAFRSVQSLVTDRGSQWPSSAKIPVVPEPSPTVHEHPVIQRIASLKGTEMRQKDEEKVQPLTSASIKGPEDFEMFVQGGDTVKYTLTPENVRDEPNLASQYYAKRSLDGVPPSPVQTTTPVEVRAARTSAIKQALAAIPDSIMESGLPTRTATRETRRSVSRPTTRNTSVSRKTGLMAREPRVMTESTRDIADFIRSTGPDREPQPINLLASKSSSALPSQKPNPVGPPRTESFGGVPSKTPNRSSIPSGRAHPVSSLSNGKSKSTMQPRAATSASGGSAELIDFIRNGPNQVREHRISRTVAPFRTTMDSEQLNDWSDQILSQPDIVLANGETTDTHKQSVSSIWSSNQASANSRSALISSIEAPLTNKASNSRINESEPTRKAYRNKDPYAVPSDDEDDILMNPPPKRNEESMVDFLRDTDPAVGQAPGLASQTNHVAPKSNVKAGSGKADTHIPRSGRSTVLPGLQIATATHIHNVIPSPTSAGPRTKLEARSPGTPVRNANHDKSIHGGTSELADFLRHSSPPETKARSRPPHAMSTPSLGRLSKPPPPPRAKSDKDSNGRRSFFGGIFFGRGSKKV